jgi:transcriptional regulator with XRE-family HTH domain
LVKNLRGIPMLTNNIELDLKTRMIEEGVTQTEIAEGLGVSIPYVNRIIRGREHIVNKTFVKMMDELGYDVELTYKRKSVEAVAR